MSIGSRIKQRREELGITQTELAEMLGVTKGAIGNYETDANSPKASILYKVFEALQCDANFIFQDEEKQPAPEGELSKEAERMVNLLREIPAVQRELAVDLVESVLLAVIRNAPIPEATPAASPAEKGR